MQSRPNLYLYIALSLALMSAPLHAQVSPSMDSPNTPTRQHDQPLPPPDDTQQEPAPSVRATANIVNLFFNVRDKSGVPISTLTQGDCTVLEDKQPRPLKNFGLVRDQHLTLGVLLDTSGSQQTLLGMEQEAAKQFLRQVLEPKTDQAFVITFDLHVDLVADYTNSLSRLDRALDKAQINTGAGTGDFIPGLSKPGGTALFDAVYLAGNDEFKQEAGRHAMVIITDGQDEGSKEKIQGAIEAAQRADALIFVLLMYDPRAYVSLGYAGDRDMKKLSDATGGHVYVIGHDGRKLEKAFDDLALALHTEYVATFVPNVVDGKYHPLEVQCKGEGLKVESRKGYYATKPQDIN
jgi:VWFA-related protein